MEQFIDIYKIDTQVTEPYVVLDLVKRDPANINAYQSEQYKVVCSWLDTSRKCIDFKLNLYDAIVEYNPSLEEWATSIILSTLKSYKKLLHASNEQDGLLGAPDTIKTSKPLGEMFAHLLKDDEKLRGIKNPAQRNGLDKQVIFVIGGMEFKFTKDMAEWVIRLIRQSISEQGYPLGLGIGMMELEHALNSGNIDTLIQLNNAEPMPPIVKSSQILPRFCLNLHKLICGILDEDKAEFTSKQLKLYILVLEKFNTSGWEKYQTTDKTVMDRFRMLLKRNMLRHS